MPTTALPLRCTACGTVCCGPSLGTYVVAIPCKHQGEPCPCGRGTMQLDPTSRFRDPLDPQRLVERLFESALALEERNPDAWAHRAAVELARIDLLHAAYVLQTLTGNGGSRAL